MMVYPGFIFLQIIMGGLSDHDDTALNKHLQQTEVDVVFFFRMKLKHKRSQVSSTFSQQCAVCVESLGASKLF